MDFVIDYHWVSPRWHWQKSHGTKTQPTYSRELTSIKVTSNFHEAPSLTTFDLLFSARSVKTANYGTVVFFFSHCDHQTGYSDPVFLWRTYSGQPLSVISSPLIFDIQHIFCSIFFTFFKLVQCFLTSSFYRMLNYGNTERRMLNIRSAACRLFAFCFCMSKPGVTAGRKSGKSAIVTVTRTCLSPLNMILLYRDTSPLCVSVIHLLRACCIQYVVWSHAHIRYINFIYKGINKTCHDIT